MSIKDSLKISLGGLRAHKRRSALTILGVVIGISAIIMVMSVGQGAENLILGQLQGLGSSTIVIKPGREPKGPSDVASAIMADSLKDREVKALRKKSNVPGLANLDPEVMISGSVVYKGETFRAVTMGTSDFLAEIFDIFPAEGTFFNDEDIKQRASVAVIGEKVKQELFGPSDALGEKIKIKNRNFRVIGILPPKGQISMFNVDELVAVPYTTAQRYLSGIDHYHAIIVRAENEEIVPQVVQDIKLTLRELHDIINPDKDDFYVMSQADMAERVSMITGILTALLVSVAAISLIVGGIGIMNIMLVSVTERKREIGLRKAVGASNKDILTQFLFEAVMLTVIGGLVGIILGAGFSYLIAIILSQAVAAGWAFTFPVSAALLGCGVSIFIGLVFGIYPARQASLKNPIESLRYE